MSATLYLELNPDRLLAGAARARSAMRETQRASSELGAAMERAAQTNQAYTLSVDQWTGALVRVPAAETAAAAATTRGTAAAVAATVAQTALNTAKTVGMRVASGFLRAIAITPLVAFATAATGVAIELGKMALGLSENTAEAKRMAEQMERAKAAADGFKSSVEAFNAALRAGERSEAIGDVAGVFSAREARLDALQREYERIKALDKGVGVKPEVLTKLGVTPSPGSALPVTGKGLYDRFNATALIDPAVAAADLKRAINEQRAAIDREKAAHDLVTDAAGALVTGYNRLSGITPQAEALFDRLSKAGVPTGLAKPAATGLSYVQSLGGVAGSKPDAATGPDTDYIAAQQASRDAALEHALAMHEASEAALRQATIGKEAYDREQYLSQYRAELTESMRFSAETVDRLTSAEAGLYDQITARAKVEDVNAKALKQQSALAGDFAGATSVALTTFTDNVHDAAGAALQFVQGIANALLQQTAIQPASEAIGSGIASYFSGGAGTGTTPSRLGNVFDQTGLIHRFAYGDVVDSRTRFYFGGGQRGEMGEAGPEAVMPLRRGSDGKLGVAAAGGGATSITLNFPHVADGHGVRRSAQQSAAALARQMERRG